MITPIVTVYITNFNYGRFIRQSIESVLLQSLQDFELLIIDDGSTDNSKDIIETYRDNPKISIIYQTNKGLNVTNNIAMRASKGKYIMRLDADDFLMPNALEVMCQILENDDELGLVFPDYYLVDDEGHKVGLVQRHNFEDEVSLLDQPAHGACTLIRRKSLLEVGGYDEMFSCQDGYELWIKFIHHFKVRNVNTPLFFYRQHSHNLTRNESRILTTRMLIKESFLKTREIRTPVTLAVLPVRSTYVGGENLPFIQLGDTTLLGRIATAVTQSAKVSHLVITSAEPEIVNYCQRTFADCTKISIVPRPDAYARINESLFKTFQMILDLPLVSKYGVEAIMALTLEYPFLSTELINDAVNTLTIFNADSLLSVRPDNSLYYQHTGNGMRPILDQEKFTKLEREALYKAAGGITISKVETLLRNKRMVSGNVGHIVVDPKAAFGIFSEFDLDLLKSWDTKNFISIA